MAQSTTLGSIPDGSGASVRAAINTNDNALCTQNEGTSSPTTTHPFMTWRNNTTKFLYQRNSGDSAWEILENYGATTDPGTADDSPDGYIRGSIWINTTANKYWVCTNPTTSAAVWREISTPSLPDSAINVKDPLYGAIGDNTHDDTTNIQAALTAAAGKELYIPPGKYKLSAALTLTGGVTIRGAGMGISQLRWTSGASTTGISLVAASGYPAQTHTVTNLSLITAKSNTGIALNMDFHNQIQSSGGALVTLDRMRMRCFVENVECMGVSLMDSGSPVVDGWAIGVKSIAAVYGTFHNVAVTGKAVSAVQAEAGSIGIQTVGYPETGALENGHPVVFMHDKCNFNFCDVGIQTVNAEGVFIHNCNAVACNYGYNTISEGYLQPQAVITESHANCYNNGIWVNGMSQIQICNNLIYCVQTAPANHNPIVISGVPGGVIHGNNVASIGPTNHTDGMVFVGCSYLNISNNYFQGSFINTGIVLDANTHHCKGSNNINNGLSVALVADAGTSNTVT